MDRSGTRNAAATIRRFLIQVVLAGVVPVFWAALGTAAPYATLRWTNPCFNAAVDDSGNAYCEVGQDSCKDLAFVRIYGQPSYGGGWRSFIERGEVGRECQQDSVQVDLVYVWATWHFYLVTFDTSGNVSCASNVVVITGSQVTGVPEEPVDQIVSIRYFDVLGRLVKERLPFKIYFYKIAYRSGKTRVGRVVGTSEVR